MTDIEHVVDPTMIAQSDDKLAIFSFLMTQYLLKAGMHKFGVLAKEHCPFSLASNVHLPKIVGQNPQRNSAKSVK